jgi:ATP-dependent exoDNAse (exonuclease V) beta subunit
MKTHLLIKASAGTGKTTALTNRIVSLLLAGVSPTTILATTFTRSAAFEIKKRILSELAKSVLGLKTTILMDQKVDVSSIFNQLLIDQDRLLICTMDSFCGDIARYFSAEIGLGSEWKVATVEEMRWCISIAIQRVLHALDDKELSNLSEVLTSRSAPRSVMSIVEWYAPELLEVAQLARQSITWGLSPVAKSDQRTLNLIVEELVSLEVPTKHWANAREVLIDHLDKKQWLEPLDSGLLANFCKQGSYYRKPFDSKWSECLSKLKNYLVNICISDINSKADCWQKLGNLLEHEYLKVITERQSLGFQDVKYLVHTLYENYDQGSSLLNDLFYRLDTRVQHVLLDEFQDTALQEWQVLYPLLQEVLSSNGDRTFFCVGDIKQAIYNWRGGQVGFLRDLPSRWSSIETSDLYESWRSSPVIIDFCNIVFQSLAQVNIGNNYQEVFRSWSDGYPLHVSRLHLSGYVEVNKDRNDDDNVDANSDFQLAVRKTIELVGNDSNRKVAILCRTNEGVQNCANLLRNDFPDVSFSIDGNISFASDLCIQGILSALMVIERPDSLLDRYYLASCSLGQVNGYNDWKCDNQAVLFGKKFSHILSRAGILGVVNSLVQLAMFQCDFSSRVLCCRLISVASEYRGSSLREFVEIVRNMQISQQEERQIILTTIHKSKGQEYDAVILCDLDRPLVSQVHRRAFLTRSNDVFSGYTDIVPMPKKLLIDYEESLQRLWQSAEEDQIFEALNILYVAITRAKQDLYVYLPSKINNNTFAFILESIFPSGYRSR